MKTLITGGAGFMGAHILDILLADGHDRSIVVLDDLSGGFLENVDIRNIDKRCRFVEGSIYNHDLVNRLFEKNEFEYVFHCAAYAAEGLSHFIRRFNYENNLIGSINLINASVRHKVKCFVFLSSIAVYGETHGYITENTPPRPEDPYGISKYAVEMDLMAANNMFGLNYIIFRPHNVYGELQNIGDPYRNVIGIFMNQCLQDKPLTIFGDGQQSRQFTYIRDICPYIARSAYYPKVYNQTFNCGTRDKHYTVAEIAQLVCQAMGKPLHTLYLPERNEVKHAWADHLKFEEAFGTVPITPIETGLTNMANWVKEHGPRQGKPFSNIEIDENMPMLWKELTC